MKKVYIPERNIKNHRLHKNLFADADAASKEAEKANNAVNSDMWCAAEVYSKMTGEFVGYSVVAR